MSNEYRVPAGEFPAFPESGLAGSVSGLTKREYFALHIFSSFENQNSTASYAVELADKLIAALQVQECEYGCKGAGPHTHSTEAQVRG